MGWATMGRWFQTWRATAQAAQRYMFVIALYEHIVPCLVFCSVLVSVSCSFVLHRDLHVLHWSGWMKIKTLSSYLTLLCYEVCTYACAHMVRGAERSRGESCRRRGVFLNSLSFFVFPMHTAALTEWNHWQLTAIHISCDLRVGLVSHHNDGIKQFWTDFSQHATCSEQWYPKLYRTGIWMWICCVWIPYVRFILSYSHLWYSPAWLQQQQQNSIKRAYGCMEAKTKSRSVRVMRGLK